MLSERNLPFFIGNDHIQSELLGNQADRIHKACLPGAKEDSNVHHLQEAEAAEGHTLLQRRENWGYNQMRNRTPPVREADVNTKPNIHYLILEAFQGKTTEVHQEAHMMVHTKVHTVKTGTLD